jgi:DNA-directed RNA polymerase specialized sigma24 family protein
MQKTAPVALRADRHYAPLRDRVWLRVVADDPRLSWVAFEDAYQETWAWIAGQQRAGRTVSVDSGSPVAYLAQAVRRRYVDELRARRRGLGRAAPAPVVEALDDHRERLAAPGTGDVDEAREARRAVSAAFLLARERLAHRELQAFALSFLLEMKPAEGAEAMGVSPKRFRNLRWQAWREVGPDVISLLDGSLHWCDSPEAAALRARALAGDPEAAAPLRVHLADCAACSYSLAEARRAASIVVPLPLVLGSVQGAGGALGPIGVFVAGARERLIGWVVATSPSGWAATGAVVVVAAGAGLVLHERHGDRAPAAWGDSAPAAATPATVGPAATALPARARSEERLERAGSRRKGSARARRSGGRASGGGASSTRASRGTGARPSSAPGPAPAPAAPSPAAPPAGTPPTAEPPPAPTPSPPTAAPDRTTAPPAVPALPERAPEPSTGEFGFE